MRRATLRNNHGITLVEILIVSILLSLVIGVAISIFMSGARFLGSVRATSQNFQVPNITPLLRAIDMSKSAYTSQGGNQVNLICDCDLNTYTRNTQVPDQTGAGSDDTYAHIRIVGGNLRWRVDNDPAGAIPTVPNGGPNDGEVLLTNVNNGQSQFSLQDPTNTGTPTVVMLKIVLTNPAMTLKTQVALGGAKR